MKLSRRDLNGDIGPGKRDRKDYVSDPAARSWTGADTDRAQAVTQQKRRDPDAAGTAARRDNALKGKIALRSNIITVFAWLPTSLDDELPALQHPHALEENEELGLQMDQFPE
eukprot:5149141-Pyramimonas_sp.AAC.1